jgi:transposase
MVQKYQDHIPFHRQETQFLRIGAEISRQDMSCWQRQIYAFLSPLFVLLKRAVKTGPVIQMDETTSQVMGEEKRDDAANSYIWLLRGGPPGKAAVIYEYRQTRAAQHAKELLEGYSGYLQTDGDEGYDCAVKGMAGIIHVGCFAHARRKFFEAAQAAKKPQSAEEGLKHIRIYTPLKKSCAGKTLKKARFLQREKRGLNRFFPTSVTGLTNALMNSCPAGC